MAQLKDTIINGNLYVGGDIQIGNTDLADYVVEQGTSGIWTYRKWNSGIAECWGIYGFSTAINTAWGSLYESGQIQPPNYPLSFTHMPLVSYSPYNCSKSIFIETSGVSISSLEKPPYLWVVRPSIVNEQNTYNISIHVVGQWK